MRFPSFDSFDHVETLNQIELCWSVLRSIDPSHWRECHSGIDAESLRRELLELLASVLWHLELALSFGPIDHEKIDVSRQGLLARENVVAWKTLVDSRDPIVTRSRAIDHHLDTVQTFNPSYESSIWVLQATLVGDATIRLGAVRVIMQALISNRDAFCNLENHKLVQAWEAARNRGYQFDGPNENLVVIVLFRDQYQHGEMSPDPTSDIKRLRPEFNKHVSVSKVVLACLVVWREFLLSMNLVEVG
jgi:hypothetical protein